MRPVNEATEQIVKAVEAAAFETGDCGHPGCTEHTERRRIIHTFAGGIGADWDVDDAVGFLREARQVAWSPHLFDHDLVAISPEGRAVRFDVRAPNDVDGAS